jgi:hypothetical protein
MSTRVSSGPKYSAGSWRNKRFLDPLSWGTRRPVADYCVYQDLASSWLQMPKRIMASSAALRNLQPPQFPSEPFRKSAAAGPFPTLASSLGRDDKV